MTKVVSWDELNFDTEGATLLLGNGASIAVSDRFAYTSLYEKAQLAKAERAVFDALSTCDFERVMDALRSTQRVCRALGESLDTEAAVTRVREALINTVHAIHPVPSEVKPKLATAATFAEPFETIVTFNYDLLLYWMINAAPVQPHSFKDCFHSGNFAHDKWQEYRKPRTERGEKSTTLVFYAHGALFLASEANGAEIKLSSKGNEPLLNVVEDSLKQGPRRILYVSEGDSESKERAIAGSAYLRVVRDYVLPEMRGKPVVACGLSFRDEYLAKIIAENPPSRLAVSVYGTDDHERQKSAMDVRNRLKEFVVRSSSEIDFFDASSAGCWIHP